MVSAADFPSITELPGDVGSREQVLRSHRRYYWAKDYVEDRDVLEVACGAGQGLGLLARAARRVVGGDVSAEVLEAARRHYGNRIELREFDAGYLPFGEGTFDVILLFEAIYYLDSPVAFIDEAHRVLRPGGTLLIVTANKDLFDFSPSPFSVGYYGVVELGEILHRAGFETRFFGDTPVESVSPRQRLLRPIKYLITASGLMPKSKRMKAVLKRLVFGPSVSLPAEIGPGVNVGMMPSEIPADRADHRHKVIHCEARRRS
jgi:SAM-dependent methyltransferase